MLSVASLCVPPTLSDPAVVQQMRFSYQSFRAALGRTDTKAGSHKTFNIIQSRLSHASLDNVTFKTTRECRSRKHISGNLFLVRVMKRGRKKVVGRNGSARHIFTVIHCVAYQTRSQCHIHISQLVPIKSQYYSLSVVQDFENIG